MDLLGELLRHSNKFFSLPTEAVFASDKANLPFKCVAQNFTGGIFDAAAIGQFLFGIDRRNCSGRLFNGFENENRGCNLWALKYEIDLQNGLATIGQRGDSIKTNLYNIHVHSKLFKKIQIKGRIGKIIQQIHVGKKTLMHLNADSNSFWRLVLRVAGVQK